MGIATPKKIELRQIPNSGTWSASFWGVIGSQKD
jgi:hypothetical protein